MNKSEIITMLKVINSELYQANTFIDIGKDYQAKENIHTEIECTGCLKTLLEREEIRND